MLSLNPSFSHTIHQSPFSLLSRPFYAWSNVEQPSNLVPYPKFHISSILQEERLKNTSFLTSLISHQSRSVVRLRLPGHVAQGNYGHTRDFPYMGRSTTMFTCLDSFVHSTPLGYMLGACPLVTVRVQTGVSVLIYLVFKLAYTTYYPTFSLIGMSS